VNIYEKDYILGMWIICMPGIRDWMGTITRPDNDSTKPWNLDYRFRYYADDKVWESKARKKFFRVHIDTNEKEDDVISHMNKVVKNFMDAGFGTEMEFHEIKGDAEKMMKVCQTSKYLHMKQGKDAEEYLKKLKKES